MLDVSAQRKLTPDNYSSGFLVDEELLGGVMDSDDNSGTYIGYVLRHTTGERLGYQTYSTLPAALEALNQVERNWIFEPLSGCGNTDCGKNGNCQGGACKKFQPLTSHSASPELS